MEIRGAGSGAVIGEFDEDEGDEGNVPAGEEPIGAGFVGAEESNGSVGLWWGGLW